MTNGLFRDDTAPPTRYLLSKHHILYGTTRKSHFIYDHKTDKKRAFSVPIFMKLINAQRQIPRTKFWEYRKKHVESMKNSLTILCKVWLSPRHSLLNSQLTRSAGRHLLHQVSSRSFSLIMTN